MVRRRTSGSTVGRQEKAASELRRRPRPRAPVVREIPQRELRNDVSRILAAVAAGARFLVTVRGQPVAELSPVGKRRTWVPWRDVTEILSRGQPDEALLGEVDEAVDQSTDDPWTRYSTPPSS